MQSNTLINPQNAYLGSIPKEGPKCIPQQLYWADAPSFVFDMLIIKQQGKLSGVQAIFVDNSTNDEPVTITSSIINQTIEIAAGYQGYFPLLVTDQVKVTCASAGTQYTSVIFLNFPIAASIWPARVAAGEVVIADPLPVTDAALEALIVGDALTVADAALDALIFDGALTVNQQHLTVSITDSSGTITTGGTSQTAMAANNARVKYRLQNIDSAENLWFRDDGSPAAIDAEGTFVLLPYGAFEGNSQDDITVNATTTGHKFSLTEQ